MSSFFDDLARGLATPMPRRRALRTIGAGLAVAAIPALRPDRAVSHAGSATGCPGLSWCKGPNTPCCVVVSDVYTHSGGCCAPKGTCCKGADSSGEARSWCCEENWTCGKWGTASQCTCSKRCSDGSCCPRSKGRCVNGKCCPAIRTTFASGTNTKGVACCPPGTIAVPDNKQNPSNVGQCCRKGDPRCCQGFWSKDDELAQLKPDPKKEIKRGRLCVNGRIRKS